MMNSIFQHDGSVSRAITAENLSGKPGVGGQASSELGISRKGSPCLVNVPSGATVTIADIQGCGIIEHMWFTLAETTKSGDYMLRDVILKIYWDNEETPSVETPLGDFFCCGFGRQTAVQSLPICVNPRGGYNCYFPMPFKSRARFVIENQHPGCIPDLFYQIDYSLHKSLPEETLYFHAQWRRQRATKPTEDYVILDGVQGRGKYVGTYLALTTLERHWWGEGEVKFFIDDDQKYPTICGTGTEDYFGGAWSFGTTDDGIEKTFCTLYSGYPYYNKNNIVSYPYSNNDCLPMRGLYRWHIPDPIRFEKALKVTIQQIGRNQFGMFEREDDYASIAYWYQNEPHTVFPKLPTMAERWPR